jgi:hypothetical protein
LYLPHCEILGATTIGCGSSSSSDGRGKMLRKGGVFDSILSLVCYIGYETGEWHIEMGEKIDRIGLLYILVIYVI